MFLFALLIAITAPMFSGVSAQLDVPSLQVPACPQLGTIKYSRSVPNLTDFPLTQVDLCYDDNFIQVAFTAFNETNFYYNETQTTNDPIWQYEVMEGFFSRCTSDPQTYLELEVSPNNVTFQAFIYNPSRVRAKDAPIDTMYLSYPLADGLVATTSLVRDQEMWISGVQIPLGLFNVDEGKAKGEKWRMNFFRTATSPDMFPDQLLGAWSPTNESNFHMTPFFGNVEFV